MSKMYYKNDKHYYYCMRKKLNKKYKLDNIVTEQQLYDATSNIYFFTVEHCEVLNQKYLRFPTDYYSYVLYNCKECNELKDLINGYNDCIKKYKQIISMSIDDISSDIEIYNNYAVKRDVKVVLTERIYWDKINEKFVKYSEDIIDLMETIKNVSGVYRLFDENKKLLYIGKSYGLGKRILSSRKERNATYFSYSIINNKADTDIYEAYYIAKDKPLLNGIGNTDDIPTVVLDDLTFSEPMKFGTFYT